MLHITRSGGRAQSVPTLAGLAGPRGKVTDEWAQGPNKQEMTTVHGFRRRELFTQIRVQGAPPASALARSRVTSAQFKGNGRRFTIAVNSTTRSTAHRDLGGEWIGTTRFLVRSG